MTIDNNSPGSLPVTYRGNDGLMKNIEQKKVFDFRSPSVRLAQQIQDYRRMNDQNNSLQNLNSNNCILNKYRVLPLIALI